jgi:hypothetical protein
MTNDVHRLISRRVALKAISAAIIATSFPAFRANAYGELGPSEGASISNLQRHLIMVTDDRIPVALAAQQCQAFAAAGYSTQRLQLLEPDQAVDATGMAMVINDQIVRKLMATEVPFSVTVFAWTGRNRHLLELPLLTIADVMIVRASGPALVRRLIAQRPAPFNPESTEIEDLVDRMRKDGRPFLVSLSACARTALVEPDDELLN